MPQKDQTLFLKYKDLSSRESYEYYKQHRKKVCKGIDQYNNFERAVNAIFKLIKKTLLENEQGVCIKDLGYFCMLRTKERKKIYAPYMKSILKQHTLRYKYKPFLFPDVMYKEWHMEYAFGNNIYYQLSKIGTEKEYRLHKILCDSLIIMEDFNEVAEKNKKNPIRNNNYKKEARK